jgi:hypothetical protein
MEAFIKRLCPLQKRFTAAVKPHRQRIGVSSKTEGEICHQWIDIPQYLVIQKGVRRIYLNIWGLSIY